jgi:hypothetical protein
MTTDAERLIESLTFERDQAERALQDYKALVKGAEWVANETTSVPTVIHGYVVVLFGSASPGDCNLNKCPMGLAAWFRTRQEAEQYFVRMPGWTEPHILSVVRESET